MQQVIRTTTDLLLTYFACPAAAAVEEMKVRAMNGDLDMVFLALRYTTLYRTALSCITTHSTTQHCRKVRTLECGTLLCDQASTSHTATCATHLCVTAKEQHQFMLVSGKGAICCDAST